MVSPRTRGRPSFAAPSPRQEILEKFEFFPIKCRIQRASEIYQGVLKKKRAEQDNQPEQLKIKVPPAARRLSLLTPGGR